MEYLHQEKTEKIIQVFFKVYNTLGYGFLEKVYQNALLIELRRMGFECKSQYPIRVFYEAFPVGDYFADPEYSGLTTVLLLKIKQQKC